ncbi:MAG: hypothetical protein ACLU4N_26385 [Butyricimonas faecihominis]
MANQYCLPYCEANLVNRDCPCGNNQHGGISRPFLSRRAHRFIDEDLTEALKIKVTTTDQPWRVSQPTIQLFIPPLSVLGNK